MKNSQGRSTSLRVISNLVQLQGASWSQQLRSSWASFSSSTLFDHFSRGISTHFCSSRKRHLSQICISRLGHSGCQRFNKRSDFLHRTSLSKGEDWPVLLPSSNSSMITSPTTGGPEHDRTTSHKVIHWFEAVSQAGAVGINLWNVFIDITPARRASTEAVLTYSSSLLY